MSAYDIISSIVEDLKDNYDEFIYRKDFKIAIDEEVDNHLIYTSNIFDIARSYVSEDKLIPLFIEEFMDDVYAAVYVDDELSQYMNE